MFHVRTPFTFLLAVMFPLQITSIFSPLSFRHCDNEYTGKDSLVNVYPRFKRFGVVHIMIRELQLHLYSCQSVGQLPFVVYGF
jgi:hypothetical protein